MVKSEVSRREPLHSSLLLMCKGVTMVGVKGKRHFWASNQSRPLHLDKSNAPWSWFHQNTPLKCHHPGHVLLTYNLSVDPKGRPTTHNSTTASKIHEGWDAAWGDIEEKLKSNLPRWSGPRDPVRSTETQGGWGHWTWFSFWFCDCFNYSINLRRHGGAVVSTVAGALPFLGFLCVEFSSFPCVCVGSLQVLQLVLHQLGSAPGQQRATDTRSNRSWWLNE